MLTAVARRVRVRQSTLSFARVGSRACAGAPAEYPSHGDYVPEYISPINGAPRLPAPWNKWFPYEPVPCTPRFFPYIVWCEAGQTYLFDSSGESRTQPWAESETFCRERGFAHTLYQPRFTGWKAICACKHSPGRPLADFTFILHWADYNIVPACAAAFGVTFFFGLITTWMAHP